MHLHAVGSAMSGWWWAGAGQAVGSGHGGWAGVGGLKVGELTPSSEEIYVRGKKQVC